MTRDEAARLLGVEPGAAPDEIRHAFRRQLFRHHPDVTGVMTNAAPTHQLITAYRLLNRPQDTPESPGDQRARDGVHRTTITAGPRPAGTAVDGETIHLHLPPAVAFAALLEVGHGLGEVAYVDRSIGIMETIVVFDEYPVCSVVCTAQPSRGRAAATDVAVMVESLTGAPPPPATAVTALVADRLRELLRRGS